MESNYFRHRNYIVLVICLISSSYSQSYSYYEIPEEGRPASAFSLCCCKEENKDNEHVLYSCKFVDGEACPGDTEQYNVAISQCPSSLMFTKYNH